MSDPPIDPSGRRVTFCRICEAVCGMVARVEDGRIVKLEPDRDNPHSRGHICVKGPAMRDVAYDPDRILTPLRRTGSDGAFEPVSWTVALDDIADRLAALLTTDGDAVATYLGNPTVFNSFATATLPFFCRQFGLRKHFSATSQDHASRKVASHILYGDHGRYAIPDLPRCDLLVILGSNPLVSHGSLLTAPRIREDLDEIAARGRVIVVDPRLTETAARYEHVPITPDTDIWLLVALLHILFRDGHAAAFVEQACDGGAALREAVRDIDVALAARRCGIAADRIEAIAAAFAATPRAAVYSRVGICRGRFSTLANVLVDAINIVAGKFGVPGGSIFGPTLRPGPPDPGGYGEIRSRIGGLPNISIFLPSVIMPDEILVPGPGQVRGLIMLAGNPVLSAPGGDRLVEALRSLDLFVACDLFVNESNRFADYILPTTTFLERADLPLFSFPQMTAPFLQSSPAVIAPLGDTRSEEWILREIGRRLQPRLTGEGFELPSGRGVVDGLLRNSRFDGLSLDRLEGNLHGMTIAPAEPSAWHGQIGHADARICLWDDRIAAEMDRLARSTADEGLRLFGQRKLRSINSWMHNVDRLVRSDRAELLIHPDDAEPLGIASGDRVRVSNVHGTIEVTASLSRDIVAGSLCYPHGWGHDGSWQRANQTEGANVNLLSPRDPSEVEQLSGSSLLDGIIVTVERIGGAGLLPS